MKLVARKMTIYPMCHLVPETWWERYLIISRVLQELPQKEEDWRVGEIDADGWVRCTVGRITCKDGNEDFDYFCDIDCTTVKVGIGFEADTEDTEELFAYVKSGKRIQWLSSFLIDWRATIDLRAKPAPDQPAAS